MKQIEVNVADDFPIKDISYLPFANMNRLYQQVQTIEYEIAETNTSKNYINQMLNTSDEMKSSIYAWSLCINDSNAFVAKGAKIYYRDIEFLNKVGIEMFNDFPSEIRENLAKSSFICYNKVKESEVGVDILDGNKIAATSFGYLKSGNKILMIFDKSVVTLDYVLNKGGCQLAKPLRDFTYKIEQYMKYTLFCHGNLKLSSVVYDRKLKLLLISEFAFSSLIDYENLDKEIERRVDVDEVRGMNEGRSLVSTIAIYNSEHFEHSSGYIDIIEFVSLLYARLIRTGRPPCLIPTSIEMGEYYFRRFCVNKTFTIFSSMNSLPGKFKLSTLDISILNIFRTIFDESGELRVSEAEAKKQLDLINDKFSDFKQQSVIDVFKQFATKVSKSKPFMKSYSLYSPNWYLTQTLRAGKFKNERINKGFKIIFKEFPSI